MKPRSALERGDERVLPLGDIPRFEGCEKWLADLVLGRQPAECGAEPLAVRCVATFEQEAEPHHIADESRGEDPGSELVTHLGRPPDERLLLVDSPPLAREKPQPDLVRIPGERVPDCRELPGVVVVHGAACDLEQDLLWRSEPVPEGTCRPEDRSRASRRASQRVSRRPRGGSPVRRPSRSAWASRGTRPEELRRQRELPVRRPPQPGRDACGDPSHDRSSAPCRIRERPSPCRRARRSAVRLRPPARRRLRRASGRARSRT